MKYLIALFSLVSLSACGGGNSDPATTDIGSDNNGCTQEYYQTMFGKYTGVIDLNTASRAPQICQWTASIEISGESVLTRCALRTSTAGTVTQSTFYPDDIADRYQCIEETGERTISEPIGGTFPVTELPGLNNSNFPVDVEFSFNDAADRGPYFGDESLNSAYVNLYDGTTSRLVRQITINGDDTITMRDTNGVLLGTLVKE